MVYLMDYRNLRNAPAKTLIMCLERRKDDKLATFTPLLSSQFVKDLCRWGRAKQAVTEQKRLAKGCRDLLDWLKKAQEDLILVSWEAPDSPIGVMRQECLNAWKISFEVLSGRDNKRGNELCEKF